MKTYHFSIPGIIELTREQGWETIDKKNTVFFVYRTHFAIKEHPAENTVRKGEIIRAIEKSEGVSVENTFSESSLQETICVEELFKQRTIEKEVSDEIKAQLSMGSNDGVSFVNILNSSINGNFTEKIVHVYSEHIKDFNSIKKEYIETNKIKISLQHRDKSSLYCVNAYQQYTYDIFIVGIDYLCVEYKRSLFGLRRKRTKWPKLNKGKKQNYIRVKKMLGSLVFWKNLPKSIIIVPQDKYVCEVEDTDEIKFIPPTSSLTNKYLPLELSPSLYKIANAAFPFKWVNRKTEWTKEELIKLEEEDYKDSFVFNNSQT